MDNLPRAAGTSKQPTLGRRLFVALVAPIALLLVMGVALGAQVLRLVDAAWWVEHSDEVIGKLNRVERMIVDQEASFRGYLLSDDPQILQAYEAAHPRQALAEVRSLSADDPAQIARLDEIAARYDAWLEESRRDLQKRDKSSEALLTRKAKMDDVRASIAEAIDVEHALLAERAAASRTSYRTTAWLFVTLLLATGVALAVFSRRQLGAIAGTYETALGAEREAREAIEREAWIRAGHASLSDALRGELTPTDVGKNVLRELTRATGADVGAFYASAREGWELVASHALDQQVASKQFASGEGLVGQAALDGELVVLTDVPADYLASAPASARASRGASSSPRRCDRAAGAIVELGFLRPPGDAELAARSPRRGELASATRSAQLPDPPRGAARGDAAAGRGAPGPAGGAPRQQRGARGAGPHAARRRRPRSRSSSPSSSRPTRSSRSRRELLERQTAELVDAQSALVTAKATELERVEPLQVASSSRTCRTSCARRSTAR